MIWLIGAGNMARDYIDVLAELDKRFIVIGRSEANSQKLASEKSVEVISGGLNAFLETRPVSCDEAVVAVDVDDLYEVTVSLINYGVKKVLLEKPGGINFEQISLLNDLANEKGVDVYIAYNRRYFTAVKEALKLIEADGGLESFHFEFTEWADDIARLPKSEQCKKHWLLANSSHVIDMAFFIGGFPKSISSYSSGVNQLSWHPSASKFSGSGIAENDVLFTYCANWNAPGRWSLEFMTRQNRYVFRPMEKLAIQRRNSITSDFLDLDYSKEYALKPGLYGQVDDFLHDVPSKALLRLEEHRKKETLYNTIAHGGFI